MTKLLQWIILSTLIFSVLANAEVKRVGYILPLTGDAAIFGQEAQRGIAIAQEELRAQGQSIEVFFEDEKCMPRDAVGSWHRLANRNDITTIIGPACSGSIISVAPLSMARKRPLIALWDAGQEVASSGNEVFSIGFDSEREGRIVARHLLDHKLRQAAVIWESDKFAELVKEAFTRTFEEEGGEIVGSGVISPGEQEVRALISKLISKKPQAFFVSPAYSSAAIVNAIRTLGYDGPIFGQDTFGIPGVIEAATKAMEGAIFADVKVSEENAIVRKFKAEYIKKFDGKPTSLTFAALGYDSLMLASQLPKLEQARALKEIEWSSVLPRNSFKSGNMIQLEPALFEVVDGRVVPFKNKDNN